MTIKSLLEVVQTGAKNIDISVMKKGEKVKVSYRNIYYYNVSNIWCAIQSLPNEEIAKIVEEIETEKKEEDERRKGRLAATLEAQGGMAT